MCMCVCVHTVCMYEPHQRLGGHVNKRTVLGELPMYIYIFSSFFYFLLLLFFIGLCCVWLVWASAGYFSSHKRCFLSLFFSLSVSLSIPPSLTTSPSESIPRLFSLVWLPQCLPDLQPSSAHSPLCNTHICVNIPLEDYFWFFFSFF